MSDRVAPVQEGRVLRRRAIPVVRLFSSASDEPVARRPTDIVLFVVSLVLLAILWQRESSDGALDKAINEVVKALPTFFDPFWDVLHDLVGVWAIVLMLMALFAHRRWSLLRDQLLAGLAAVALLEVSARVVNGEWPDVAHELLTHSGPPSFPAARLAIATGVIVASSPHVSRGLRRSGRAILVLGALAAVALQVTDALGALAGFFCGVSGAALIHMLFGSPGGRPTAAHVTDALTELGFDARDVRPAAIQPSGGFLMLAADDSGPLEVKVFGRDAWDGQLLMSLWRSATYRDGLAPVHLTRAQLAEHEAFLTLLAARGGAPVPEVLAAGSTSSGDVLLVQRSGGAAFTTLEAERIDDALVDRAWRSLTALHDAGVAHGRISPQRLRLAPSGEVVFADLAQGCAPADDDDFAADDAQLMTSTALFVGPERAVAAAARSLGPEPLADVLPLLQPAVFGTALRHAVRDSKLDVDDLRERAVQAAGVESPPLVKLRRVTWGSVLRAALLLVVVYVLVTGIAGLGLDSIVSELQGANWAWLGVTLMLAQLPRTAEAVALIGASPKPLPYFPVVGLEFAIAFVNLAVPSSAGRIATNIRFFQKVGVPATGAVTIGALDGFGGFVVQLGLMATILLFGLGSLDIKLTLPSGGDDERLVLIVAAVLVLAVGIVFAIRPFRRRIVDLARNAAHWLRVLRSPKKLALIIGGNVVAQVLYVCAIGACAHAFGGDPTLANLILINTGVSLFAGLLPIPGGMGVAEAGLTAGLVAAGMPESAALATALCYRFASYYLPPIWGWFSLQWLRRHQYL